METNEGRSLDYVTAVIKSKQNEIAKISRPTSKSQNFTQQERKGIFPR
ncbi:hypothetical protein [Rickettsiales endosymbiont of Stachyamoeba lipophora]|nr:hypothetical protein [Rickettsiales endosymbiont of Stachyamoeba lipophora]